jgi:hypothetical protein
MAGRPRRHRMEQSPGMVREGFRLLMAVNPVGVITGFGFCAASTTDQQVAETPLFGERHWPEQRLASVGCASRGPYIADKGFEGTENHRQRWLECYGAQVIHPPKRNSRKACSKRLRQSGSLAFARSR